VKSGKNDKEVILIDENTDDSENNKIDFKNLNGGLNPL